MYLNNIFTVEEIIVAINKLKTYKACGMDQLLNDIEYANRFKEIINNIKTNVHMDNKLTGHKNIMNISY